MGMLLEEKENHRRCHYIYGRLKITNTWINPSYFLKQLFSASVTDHLFLEEDIFIMQLNVNC